MSQHPRDDTSAPFGDAKLSEDAHDDHGSVDDEDKSITNWNVEARAFRAKHEKQPPYLRIPFGKGHSWKNPKTIIFFFHYRVFRPWNTWRADVMFVNNFLAMITTIIALIDSDLNVNNVLGGLSLFGGNLLLHTWYGYMKYSDANVFDLNPRSNEHTLEPIRQDLAAMIHGGDPTQHDQTIQTLLTLPFIVTNTIGRYLSALVLAMMAQCCFGEGAEEKRFIATPIYWLSLIMGCLTWPIIFSLAESPVLKVLSSFALFANEELYASYLFRKTPKEFCQGYLMALLGDFFPLDDLPLGLDDVLDDALEDFEEATGVDELGKLKENAQNKTQAEEDFQERLDDANGATDDFLDKDDRRDDKEKRSLFGFFRRPSKKAKENQDVTEASESHAAMTEVEEQAPPMSDLTMPPVSMNSLPNDKNDKIKDPGNKGTSDVDTGDVEAPSAIKADDAVHAELVFSAEHPDPMLVVSVPIRDVDESESTDADDIKSVSVSRSDKSKKKKKKSKEKKPSEGA